MSVFICVQLWRCTITNILKTLLRRPNGVFSSLFSLSYCCGVMMCSLCVAVPSSSASAVFKEEVIMPPLHTLIDAVLLSNETLYWNHHLSLHSRVGVNSSDSFSSLKSQRSPFSGPCSHCGSVMIPAEPVGISSLGPHLHHAKFTCLFWSGL